MTTALERLSSGYYNPNLKTVLNPGGLSGTGALWANWNPFLADFSSVASDIAGQSETALELALTALNSPATSATSATTMTPAEGEIEFDLAQEDKALAQGQFVTVYAAPDNWFAGQITAFVAETGEITVDAMKIGTAPAEASAWTIALTGPIDPALDAAIAALEANLDLAARRRRLTYGDMV